MLPFRIMIAADVSYILDMYAVILVKIQKGLVSEQEGEEFLCGISHQLGFDRTEEIIDSEEFAALVQANLETFEAVDLARTDDILASEVDRLNTKRYYCKKAIQKKFFNSELSEKKNV